MDGRPRDPLRRVGKLERVEGDGTVVFVRWGQRG
jgi:hypothetical protein